MKKILVSLAILLFIGVIASIFVPIQIQAIDTSTADENPRDPHFHYNDWTVCCNTMTKACGSK